MPKRKGNTKRRSTKSKKGLSARDKQLIAAAQMRGDGVFGDINNWLKRTKILSKTIPTIGSALGHPMLGSSVGNTFKQLGYGQQGGGPGTPYGVVRF